MNLRNYLPLTVLICVIAGCTPEYLDPNDYRPDHLPKDNTYVLRDSTSVMMPEHQAELIRVEVSSVVYRVGSTFVAEVAPGDIVVNPFGGENGFIRRVMSVSTSGDEIILMTEDAEMTEAFDAWVIDSRSSKLVVKSRGGWSESYNFKTTIAGVDFTFGGNYDPDFSVDMEYDDIGFISHWTKGDPAYIKGPYMKFFMVNPQLTFTGAMTANFKTAFKGDAKTKNPFLITQVPYANYLSLYFWPKTSVSVSLKGKIIIPPFGFTVAPVGEDTLYVGHDNRTGNIFYSDVTEPEIQPIIDTLELDGLSGQVRAQAIIEFLVAPTGLYESGANKTAELKVSAELYMYQDLTIEHKGNFEDLQPRVTLDALTGAGFRAFVSASALKGQYSWAYESPRIEYPLFDWELISFYPCDAFSSADIMYDGGEAYLSVGSSPTRDIGFNLYANHELFSKHIYEYDQTHTITLPSSNDLVNTIAIADWKHLGCYLEDTYIDPSLIGNCTDEITDPRDGNEYCISDIGSYVWMTENLRYTGNGSVGKWYDDTETDENLVYGRLYTHHEIASICPAGWHIPTTVEWNDLINALGGRDEFGLNAKAPSAAVWPVSDLPDVNTFGAVPSGEYYSWLEGSSQYPAYGNRGRFARFWSSSILDDAPTMVEIGQGNEAIVNTTNSAEALGLSKFKSIRDIGFTCRCVQD